MKETGPEWETPNQRMQRTSPLTRMTLGFVWECRTLCAGAGQSALPRCFGVNYCRRKALA